MAVAYEEHECPDDFAYKCANGHTLERFVTPHENYVCDLCRSQQRTDSIMFSCRACDWDECVNCVGGSAGDGSQTIGNTASSSSSSSYLLASGEEEQASNGLTPEQKKKLILMLLTLVVIALVSGMSSS